MKPTLLFLFGALTITTSAAAQRLAAFTGHFIAEVQPPSVMAPISPALASYPAIGLAPPAPGFVKPGDLTFDSFAGLNLYTNGIALATVATTDYPSAVPPITPLVFPASLLTTLGGPVTGMAIDAITGTLWLTGMSGVVIGVSPSAGFPIVVPAFTLPFTFGPIAGLEYDAMTGLLLAVDMFGTVYPFLATGAAAGPAITPALTPPGPVGGIAIDKTGKLNGIGTRAIYISAGPDGYDMTLPAPVVFPLFAGGMPSGLAFQPMPAQSGPYGGCPCGGVMPTIGTTGPMVVGNTGFGVTLGGMGPGSPVLFGFDFTFDPAFPLLNVIGCGVGLIPSPSVITAFAAADATGTATFALPFPVTIPPGFGPIYAQAFTLCGVDPFGFVAAPMQRLTVCGV